MKIIVTGCAGMIGCYLTAELLRIYPKKEGNEIIGIDNLSRGKLKNLKESCNENYKDLTFINSDLTVYRLNWAKKFNKCDLIIHLADVVAGIGYVFSNQSYVFRTNLLINSNVTKAIYEYKPKRYIYVGTICSFPKELQLSTKSNPLVEENQFPASPESGYGWSKLMGEIEAGYLSKEEITDTVILSLHNVYGKYCDYSSLTSQVIPSLCMKAILCQKNNNDLEIWGDGQQGRAFVHAKDVVQAIMQSISKGENSGVIQIGPSNCTSVNHLAKLIIKKLNLNIKIKYLLDKPIGDIGRCANYQKAKKVLGWEPKVDLEEGLFDLLMWLKNTQ
mgnify:CR=1 FL=1|tara:strand:+ start:530 stop:1525 length:996 start_codon:yes stop_codon:yes gene_type:complete